jgi:hypothetical protein
MTVSGITPIQQSDTTIEVMLPEPDLTLLPAIRLAAMRRAGREILECHRVLDKAGLNIVGEVLRDALTRGETFYELTHYPANDVYDRESHAQYYYHAHRSDINEHGHFHCFLRPRGMPSGVTPVDYYDAASWPQGDEALSHLIAIAMDSHGFPVGLFTVNRWVTAEAWYRAEDVIRMLDHFVIDHAYPSWPVNRWISAMFVLYRPHIEALIRQRDATISAWSSRYPDRDVFEDRSLEITSQMAFSVDRTVTMINQCLASRKF